MLPHNPAFVLNTTVGLSCSEMTIWDCPVISSRMAAQIKYATRATDQCCICQRMLRQWSRKSNFGSVRVIAFCA